uniref:Dehydroquinate dehydratase/shikimate dehydrogenase n=1 Tax=Solanum tuberosum TaxID=4113 RepID=M1CER0_SOLTU
MSQILYPNFGGYFTFGTLEGCTIPHKEDALDCCTEIDPTAKAIGVVNCIINRPDGKLFGCNTDYIGAISSIEEGLEGSQPSISAPPWLVKCLWSFVLVELERQLLMVQRKKRARVVIANHIYERAREIGDVVGAKALSLHDLSDFHPENDMILANTTSIGMQPKVDDTPISKEICHSAFQELCHAPRLPPGRNTGHKITSDPKLNLSLAYHKHTENN